MLGQTPPDILERCHHILIRGGWGHIESVHLGRIGHSLGGRASAANSPRTCADRDSARLGGTKRLTLALLPRTCAVPRVESPAPYSVYSDPSPPRLSQSPRSDAPAQPRPVVISPSSSSFRSSPLVPLDEPCQTPSGDRPGRRLYCSSWPSRRACCAPTLRLQSRPPLCAPT